MISLAASRSLSILILQQEQGEQTGQIGNASTCYTTEPANRFGRFSGNPSYSGQVFCWGQQSRLLLGARCLPPFSSPRRQAIERQQKRRGHFASPTGWGAGIRTPIGRSRVGSPTVERHPNKLVWTRPRLRKHITAATRICQAPTPLAARAASHGASLQPGGAVQLRRARAALGDAGPGPVRERHEGAGRWRRSRRPT